jgi:hypothetical protein
MNNFTYCYIAFLILVGFVYWTERQSPANDKPVEVRVKMEERK